MPVAGAASAGGYPVAACVSLVSQTKGVIVAAWGLKPAKATHKDSTAACGGDRVGRIEDWVG